MVLTNAGWLLWAAVYGVLAGVVLFALIWLVAMATFIPERVRQLRARAAARAGEEAVVDGGAA